MQEAGSTGPGPGWGCPSWALPLCSPLHPGLSLPLCSCIFLVPDRSDSQIQLIGMGFDSEKDTSVRQIFEEMNSLDCTLKREIKQCLTNHSPGGKPPARLSTWGSVSCWLDTAGLSFLICNVETRRHLLKPLCPLHDWMFMKCLG